MDDKPRPPIGFLPSYATLEYVQKLALTALAISALIYVLGRAGRGGFWTGIATGAALK